MDHVIQKQVFSLSAANIKLAREWEGKLHTLVHQIVNPSIEKYFTEISSDEHIVIDQLDIDLGILNNKSPQQLEEEIRAQLASQLLRRSGSGEDQSQKQRHLFFEGKRSDEPAIEHLSHHKKNFLCFLNFLTRGVLPWWAEATTLIFEKDWISELSREEADRIAATLSRHPPSVDRLVFQFSAEFISKLLHHYLPHDADAVLQSWQSLAAYYSPRSDNGQLHKCYWKRWIKKSLALPVDEIPLREAITHWLRSAPIARAMIVSISQSSGPTPPGKDQHDIIHEPSTPDDLINEKSIPSAFVRKLIQQACAEDKKLKSRLRSSKTDVQKTAVTGKVKKRLNVDESSHTPESSVNSTVALPVSKEVQEPKTNAALSDFDRKEKYDPAADPDADDQELYVSGAGLVLLHPFLTELFTSTGLWRKEGWTSDSSRHQAVQVLSFLAFGKSGVPEYQLLLPKILCNIPLSEPLDTCAGIPEEFEQKAIELLKAVVGHWKALGNTSTEGLQEGFIQREGKVVRKNNDWHLLIEKKAQDILLNRLPWGISFIHLPWLDHSNLYVKWTD